MPEFTKAMPTDQPIVDGIPTHTMATTAAPSARPTPAGASNTNRLATAVRLGFGILLIAVSLWALLLPPLFPYSSHAVVNTKLVTVKAREAGIIQQLGAERLANVSRGDSVARVVRDADRLRRDLQDAEFSRQKLLVRIESLDAAVKTESDRLTAVRADQDRSRDGLARLQAQALTNAAAQLALRREELAEKRAAEERVTPLFRDGIVTAAAMSRARAETLDAERALREADAALSALTEGAGADPARDMIEAFASRVLSLEREIGGLTLQRIDLAAQLAELDNRLAATQRQLSENPSFALESPIKGIIWRRLVVPGEIVTDGQTIAEIADTSSLFVEAWFRRDFLNSIAVGDRANIYLIGGGDYISGRVTEIQVQERANREPDIINTAPLDPSMLRVRIELEESARSRATLGGLGKVLITSGNPGLVERGMLRLSLLLRSHQ
jgi:multidrug resistance efflux pump